MKRTFPLIITAAAGFVLIVSYFVPAWQEFGEDTAIWFDILAAIAFILGGGNLLKLHLKTISDGKPGWGYSGVTILAFLAMLICGLLKIGSPPMANMEFYGETFAPLPLSAMPEYRVAGSIPERADGERLPGSVLFQLREEDGQLVFRGWMTPNQLEDLKKYKPTLSWQCTVEELYQSAQPQDLSGIAYYPTHESLAVKGVLDDEQAAQLQSILPETDAVRQAIEHLQDQSRKVTTVRITNLPEQFTIPDEFQDRISIDGDQLSVVGPLSTKLRDQMAQQWAGFPATRPLSVEQRRQLRQDLEQLGNPLTEEQSDAFQKVFNTDWTDADLIATINTAGTPVATPRSACDLFADQQAGVTDLTLMNEASAPSLLNDEQAALVRMFVLEPSMTVEELKTQLPTLGDITDKQLTAIDQFLDSQPRDADRLQRLGFELLKVGSLSSRQKEFLFAPAAAQHAWRTQVGRLFVAAHQVKYPWSGEASEEGNAFWWLYEYVMQPLMTTTFAMLAFYVASAAFRAFRAKNLEATLLLGTAFIVLLGRTYLGVQLTAWVPDALSALKIDQMTVYIMKIFNTAGNRAIMIGIALGIASTSLKVLLGIDRSYLGSGDD